MDEFDVPGLVQQLESVKARYLILTLGQNSGHYLSPNRAYDSLVGITPSKCSRRDLIEDLYKALEPKGIRLMVYLPAGAPDEDPVAMEKLEWKRGPYRNRNFQIKWEQVIAEWSKRWGKHVSGWWFDGSYWPNHMYRGTEAPNFVSFAAAARAGNPDSILAFNQGVFVPIAPIAPEEDYTAGEMNEPGVFKPGHRFIDGAQVHMLTHLGVTWGNPMVRCDPAQAKAWTKSFVERGGVVSWDVPHDARGLILQPFLSRLRAAGEGAFEAQRKE